MHPRERLAQLRAVAGPGALGQTPARKLVIAAGLLQSSRSTAPSLPWTGTGQGTPRAARCSINPRKNGRSLASTRFS